jgi:hypothetical protein
MAYINAASSGNFARLLIRVNSGVAANLTAFLSTGSGSPVTHTVDAGTLDLPALQDITITNNANTFRWRQLDVLSEKVVSTVATNSISGNLVLDPTTFFGDGGGSTSADDKGVFNLSNEKTKVDFMVAFSGLSTDDHVVYGSGYLTNIAPAVSADSPVWVSPFTIEVDGDYTHFQLLSTVS